MARSSSPVLGRGRLAEVSAISASWVSGRWTGRLYTGPSWATVRGGTSTTVSPCQLIFSRSPSVTSPMTVASTSHLRQTAMKASTFSGVTTAHMRSCDSLESTSAGVMFAARSGTLSRSMCMPPSPAEASSDVAQDNPAPPRSWMPTTRCAAYSSRQHSMSTFSVKGSPTWTLGSFLRPAPDSSPEKVSDARTETPPMPSRPVRAPNRMILLPVPDAKARCRSSTRRAPTQRAFTSGLPA